MDFDSWLTKNGHTGFQPDAVARKLHEQWMKEAGDANFQPSAVAITNPVNTNQVVPFVTTSPNSVQPFPQERFKEGPVDKDGQQLVFDPMTGTYFPGTNRATQSVVKPKASKGGPMPIAFGPDGKMMLLPGAEDVMPTPTNVPTPTASVAPAGAGAFETNAPVAMAAVTPDPQGIYNTNARPVPGAAPRNAAAMAMAPTNAMGMAPASAPAATSAAPAMSSAQVRAAFKAGQITREQAKQMILMGGQ
jgi:hypothetical protein